MAVAKQDNPFTFKYITVLHCSVNPRDWIINSAFSMTKEHCTTRQVIKGTVWIFKVRRKEVLLYAAQEMLIVLINTFLYNWMLMKNGGDGGLPGSSFFFLPVISPDKKKKKKLNLPWFLRGILNYKCMLHHFYKNWL